jgi:adenine phosphoribosyltransferase
MLDIRKYIRDVVDFPKKGIVFKDITPLVGDPRALMQTVEELARPFAKAGVEKVAAIEARGFIFGALVAQRLGAGLAPMRKPGKLPAKTVAASYNLEYGTDSIEMHADAFTPGAKVLIVDDVLATGGTLAAACELVRKLGGQVVGVACVIELSFLHGRQKLAGQQVHSLLQVESET